MESKKFAVWVSYFGDTRAQIVYAQNRDEAINKLRMWGRNISSSPGTVRILKIMELKEE